MQVSRPALGFSIGVCASDSSPNLPSLLSFLLAEDFGGFVLQSLVVVASGCDKNVVSEARKMADSDSRILLITEPERRGKAEAINRIVENTVGEFLVMVNSDAVPEAGSVRKLLSVASEDESVGCVSAMPIFDSRANMTSSLIDLVWTAHNESSLALNHMNLSNHASDELIVIRSSIVTRLPAGVVNDGAFIAGTARLRGYKVKFCPPARVHIETPGRVADVIGQRRRILFGHAQVWRRLGTPPRTIESLILIAPLTALRLLARTVARNPRSILVLPVALVTEVSAAVLSIWDSLRSSKRHTVWRRYT
ncbi:MAG: glycosyltransferase [Nitrososphaerales archaeon]|nr:glycosyltransferase [Nitrososphaerales archaeon]